MTDTTLTVAQPSDTHAPGWALAYCAAAGPREGDFLIKIDNEYEYVEWRGDQFAVPWQVKRGYLGSTPAAHSEGATVTVEPSLGSAGGGSISATDGTTTVDPATSLSFPAHTLTDLGSGVAGVGPQITNITSVRGSPVRIHGLDGLTDASGDSVDIFGGEADDGGGANGGDITVHGGQAGAGTGAGGAIELTAGFGNTASAGGDVLIKAGDGDFGDNAVGLSLRLTGADGTTGKGHLLLVGLPTADPSIAGAIWSNSGVLTVSAG